MWEEIAKLYNCQATSGSRTYQQLKHFYENVKQRTKKEVALTNRQRFYESDKELKKKHQTTEKKYFVQEVARIVQL